MLSILQVHRKIHNRHTLAAARTKGAGPAARPAVPKKIAQAITNAVSDEDRTLTGEMRGDERTPSAGTDENSRFKRLGREAVQKR